MEQIRLGNTALDSRKIGERETNYVHEIWEWRRIVEDNGTSFYEENFKLRKKKSKNLGTSTVKLNYLS